MTSSRTVFGSVAVVAAAVGLGEDIGAAVAGAVAVAHSVGAETALETHRYRGGDTGLRGERPGGTATLAEVEGLPVATWD